MAAGQHDRALMTLIEATHAMESDTPHKATGSPTSPSSLTSPLIQSRPSNAKRPSNTAEKASPVAKRPKLSPSADSPAGPPQSRKGRACTACRKLKVKCDAADRGIIGCSRCQRLGIECINARRLRIAVEGEDGQTHPTVRKIERALEDVLQKLHMPALESYARAADQDAIVPQEIVSDFQATREPSRDPPEDEKDMAPAPMGSLYEVTQVKGLRSRLQQGNPRRRNGKRRLEADIIAQGLLSSEDAEELLQLFKTSLTRYLYNTTIPEYASLTMIRESSSVLFTAIMMVSALHIKGKEAIHAICHKQFLELVSKVMFDHFHNLDDIRGLCIAAFWQPDMSWKLSGLCIRMATELNLHHAFYKCFYTQNLTDEQRKSYFEKARLWYLLYVLDHHFSIAYGRPPVTAELLPIREHHTFLKSAYATASDHRLISQVSLFVTLSRAYDTFGLEPDRTMPSDQASLMTHDRFTENTKIWKDTWKDLLARDQYIGDYPSKGAFLHHGFAQLVLNSLALRGRSLDNLETLPRSLQPLALHAVQAAHFILQYVMEEPAYRESLVGIPLYLHSMIAFAAVFLSKLAHRWHVIDIQIDPDQTTKPLIQGVVQALRQCDTGANHMVYSMANGFERILKNWGRDIKPNGSARRTLLPRPEPPRRTDSGATLTQTLSSPDHVAGLPYDPTISPDYYNNNSMMSMSGNAYNAYNSEDDMLWNLGMGYDLLAPNGIDLDGYAMSAFERRQESIYQPS